MKILVLNCGSQSVKFQVVETSAELIAANADRVLAKGAVERLGSGQATLSFEAGAEPTHRHIEAANHRQALQIAFHLLADAGIRPAQIEGVGHRVVHGGERFTRSVRIDAEVEREIEACTELAPLHNPHNLKGYRAARELAPQAVHVAVFDTAFHQSMPASAYLYGLPYALYSQHKIRRYGFHGTAHRYLSYRFAEIHGKPESAFKLITCHLGNGCSVCAIEGGRSIDTSMGLTPLEGLLMGTRGGDVDPGVVLHLLATGLTTVEDLPALLNEQSGLLGLFGVSNDMRDVDAAARQGNERARAAIEVFCRRVRKYIGAYYALLNGADAIVFSAGIGENSGEVRSRICRNLEAIGVTLDESRNQACRGAEAELSASGRTRVWVIPADEELMIARETLGLLVVG
ncbi:MAG: acetate/propionate family kinase [Bryobacteraceae bacterium]